MLQRSFGWKKIRSKRFFSSSNKKSVLSMVVGKKRTIQEWVSPHIWEWLCPCSTGRLIRLNIIKTRFGKLHVFVQICYFPQRDLEYWAIDELIMEPCCALKYFPKIEVDFTFHLNIFIFLKQLFHNGVLFSLFLKSIFNKWNCVSKES